MPGSENSTAPLCGAKERSLSWQSVKKEYKPNWWKLDKKVEFLLPGMNINIFKNNAVWSEKHSLISSIIAGIIVGVCLLGIITPQTTNADFANNTYAAYVAKASNEAKKAAKTIKVVLTAYSSTPDQTDDTPFITASGQEVADGIVANNMLPFGTQIRIPELYGDKVFTVEDRMNRRKSDYHVDIWFPERQLAVNFGVKTAEIEVLSPYEGSPEGREN